MFSGDKAIFSVDLHPDGSRFATGGQGQDSSGRVVVWNLKPVALEKYEEDEKVIVFSAFVCVKRTCQ